MATQIKNIDGLTFKDLQDEIDRGGRFVVFSYTVSVIFMTFKRPTDIYFLRGHESDIAHSWQYALLTLVAGWWGIPWGPIYSIMSIGQAFKGKNVTNEVVASLFAQHGNTVSSVDVSPAVLDDKTS